VLIDCDTCAVRDLQCGDCVVPVLLGAAPGALEVDDGEQQALAVLAESGLVPRLRLVPLRSGASDRTRGDAAPQRGVS
jgi:hypothetical protein